MLYSVVYYIQQSKLFKKFVDDLKEKIVITKIFTFNRAKLIFSRI